MSDIQIIEKALKALKQYDKLIDKLEGTGFQIFSECQKFSYGNLEQTIENLEKLVEGVKNQ